MLRKIPWDVWIATAILIACLVTFFDRMPSIFIIVYFGVCAYVVTESFRNEIDGK